MEAAAKPKLSRPDETHLSITSASGSSTWGIDITSGALVSWRRANNPDAELLTQPVTMDFYRALTDNDRSGHGRQWVDQLLHMTSVHTRQVKWQEVEDGVKIEVTSRIAPPALAWGIDVVFTYTFRGDSLALHIHGKPSGLRLPETFARIGLTLGVDGIDAARWWGRGPGPSYRDTKQSQAFGNWESKIDHLWVDYEFPQDGGNRTDVRWVEFVDNTAANNRILRASFGDLEGASFSAMRYATKDVDQCTHPYELHARKRKDTVVRLDWMHHGMGTASCGPWTLPKYQLRTDQEFDVVYVLVVV